MSSPFEGVDGGLDALPARRFEAAIAAVLLGFVVGFVGDVPLLRPVAGTLLVLVVPGVLVLSLLGVRLDRAESAVYVVGTSIAVVLIFGILGNELLTGLFDPVTSLEPFAPVTLAAGFTALGLVGLVLVWLSGTVPRFPRLAVLDDRDVRFLLFGLHLPLLSALAAVAFLVLGTNLPWMLAMALVSLVPLWVVVRRTPRPHRWLGLWCVGLALFYQVTLSTAYFSGGDGSIEYFFGHLTLTHDSWFVGFEATKASLLSLTIFHPTVAAVTGLPLRWAIKLVYPLVFALTPVAIYLFHRRHVGDTTALLSAVVLLFLHPFFNLLAQNTRTGLAIFFLFSFALVVVDESLQPLARGLLSVLFLGGIVVSHYGVSAMFLGLAGVAYVLTRADDVVGWAHVDRPAVFSLATVAFLGVGFFAWYLFTATGTNFYKLVGVFVQDVLFGFSDFFSSESNSVQAVTRPQGDSLTFQLIKAQFIGLTLLGGIGLARTLLAAPVLSRLLGDRFPWLDSLRRSTAPDDAVVHPVAVAFAVGGAMLLFVSFTPVSIVGVARIYAVAGPFIVVFGVAEARRFLTWLFGNRTSLPAPPSDSLLAVAFAGMLLVNAGVMSAAVTHDRSPQPHFDREYILEDGTEREVYHYYRSFTPPPDVAATRWAIDHRAAGTTMFSGIRHGGYEANLVSTQYGTYHPPGPPYQPFTCEEYRTTRGYFIDSEYQHREGQINLVYSSEGSYPYIRFTDLSTLRLPDRSRVYDNGISSVYYSDGIPTREPACGG
ncbi:DUF2206 domain-containing protein [Haloarchaeobius baliensis]|uniref:DUF2206 domain-containing protein n=1 Tax=Haloarchaeobius baliensis TaxID=1670458 RepID=UPI003F883A34